MQAGIAKMGYAGRKDTDMPQDRRCFIRRFGVTLGSLIVSGSLSGCRTNKEGGLSETESRVKEQDELSPTFHTPQWEQLRQCWLNLNNKQGIRNAVDKTFLEAVRQDGDPFATTRDVLAKEHQAILDVLVAEGQVKGPVAKHMQIAFEEAAYHIARQRATCYIILPIEYAPREDLLEQADALRKVSGDLDPATVAKAQAAITQDVAFFETFKAGPEDYRYLDGNYRTGTLKASPEALEAAHLLAQLFLETPG
jgi:hypothetical protein